MKKIMMLICASALAAGAACGADATWVNTGTGALETPANWLMWDETEQDDLPALDPPGGADTAAFAPASDDIVVTSASGLTNANINVGGTKTVTFNLDAGATYRSEGNFAITRGGSLALTRGRLEGAGDRILLQDGGSLLATGSQSELYGHYVVVGQIDAGGNRMEAKNGVKVSAPGGLYVGNTATADNEAIFSGANTELSVGVIYAGASASGNALTFADGAAAYNTGHTHVGSWGVGNRLVVSNATINGTWMYVYAHYEQADNVLEVRDGARVTLHGGNIHLGDGSGSGSGIIVSGTNAVTGAPSTLEITSGNDFNIGAGNGGYGNYLIITNGGRVTSARDLFIGGYNQNTCSNRVYVVGDGSYMWCNGGGLPLLYMGGAAGGGTSYNELHVRDGGSVYLGGMSIGLSGGHDNRVVVGKRGNLTFFSNYSALGNWGHENELLVEDGGYFGVAAMTVGAGSTGKRNRLWVKNGGAVSMWGSLTLGNTDGAEENVFRVEGEGSTVTFSGSSRVYVGRNGGAMNRFEIVDGASVQVSHDVWLGPGGSEYLYFWEEWSDDEDPVLIARHADDTGADWWTASNNVLRVENATLIMNYSSDGWYSGLGVTRGGRLEFAGANSHIGVNGHLILRDSPVLRYEFGKERPPEGHPFLQVYGTRWGGQGLVELSGRPC